MAEAPRSTPVRTDWPKDSRMCGGLGGSGGNPLLAKCASTAMNIAGLGAPNLPAGWKHDVGEDGATVLVMPPPGHPFWRSSDVARQTSAMFQQLGAEKDALASELATTLEAKASMSSAIEWLQNSNRKLKERMEREQARREAKRNTKAETLSLLWALIVPTTDCSTPIHGQAKTREVQGQLEALQGGAGGGGNGELKQAAQQQQPGGGGDDPTADEFTDKNRFFASNAAGRGDAPGGEGELGGGEATTTSSAGVKAMRSEIDRLRRAVSDEQAASATLRARMRMLEAAAAGSTPRGGQPSAPRTPPHAHGGTGDGRDDDELEQLREENAALVGDVEAAQQDADAAAATARLVGAQLERARTVLVAEQGRVRTLEAALETQRGKAVALARLMRMQVQAAANGKHVDWPAVDALAAAATAPVALADDNGSADTSFDVDTAVGDDVHTAAHAPHRRPLPASGGAPPSSAALEQQYAALRAAYAALQRKHEGLQHSETLLCAALTAAHSALDSQQQQQQRHGGGGSASGRATPSPAHSPRTARRHSNSSKAGGGSPVFGSSVTSREEALSAALQSERAAAAAAEAHLQRELGDLQRKASGLSYELAALKAVQSRSDILSNGHADAVYAAGQDHAAGRIGLRQRRPADRNGDSGSDASSGDEDDQERDAHAVRHQLAAARAELRDLGVALRLALTSGVSEYAAALASVDDISTAAAASRGSDAALALKATLARYLVHSSKHGGGGEVDAHGGAPDSGLHAAAALEAARQEAADAEARALAAEAECVALRRKLGTEQRKRQAEAASDRAEPVATTAAADAPAPAEPVHEERVPRAYDGVPAADVAVQEAPTASADADAEPTPAVAPHAPPPPPPVAAAAPLPGPSQPVVLKAKPLPRVWPKAQPPPEAEDAPTAAASGDDGADTDGSSGDVPAREPRALPQLRVRTSRSARWAAQSGTGAT